MASVLNFGSINLDYVYSIDHFVKPGETIASERFETFLGGKGCNQSVALAKAGASVYHIGNIGESDRWIKEKLENWKIRTDYIRTLEKESGHAIIQLTPDGENSIIIHGGANHSFTKSQIDEILSHFSNEDVLLVQNEINRTDYAIAQAAEMGMTIFFNPAPMNVEVLNYPLSLVDVFILNETEGRFITGQENEADILKVMKDRYPDAHTLLTLGSRGAILQHRDTQFAVKARTVKAVDTTGAGDTFIGYFMASWVEGRDPTFCLEQATAAAAITVTRKGGADSIPFAHELQIS